MRIACSCLVMVLLISGCTTTGKVDQMIDSKVSPQIEQIDAQFDAQAADAAATLEGMKGFIARLGTALDANVKELQAEVNGLKSQLADLESSTQSDVSTVDGNVSSLSETVESLTAAVEALAVDTAAAKTAADDAMKTATRAISGK